MSAESQYSSKLDILKNMKKIVFGIFILIAWVSCKNQQSTDIPANAKDLKNLTVYSPDAEPPQQIQLKKEQIIGGENKIPIGRFMDVAVDNNGRVYIADGEQRNIKVFAPDGEYITSLGRKGKGPGEFTNISNLHAIRNQLFVHDNSRQRVVVFSLNDFNYDHTIKIADNRGNFDELREAYPGRFHAVNDSMFQIEFYKTAFPEGKKEWKRAIRTSFYYPLDENGRITSDSLFQMKSAVRVFVPVGGYTVDRRTGLYGKALKVVSGAGNIYRAWSDDFLIKVYNPDGQYQRAFYYPYERASLSRESADDAKIPDFILKGMSRMDLPDNWPALNAMLIDDQNRIWISTIVKNQNIYEWWVLKDSGQLIAKFTRPRDQSFMAIKNGYLYSLETKGETELKQVVKYRISLKLSQ
jgi:hypothetical protein